MIARKIYRIFIMGLMLMPMGMWASANPFISNSNGLRPAEEDNVNADSPSAFTHLDWSTLSIEDSLPVFCKTIPLGREYKGKKYNVVVEYPEYVEATRRETEMLNLLHPTLGLDPQVETFLGVSRKQGYLDVRLMPVVKREGKYMKLKSCKLTLITTPTDADAKSAEADANINSNSSAQSKGLATRQISATAESGRYAAHSVLKDGRWVKIRVKDEGIYSLSRSFLASLGFSDPTRVKLYGYGGRIQTDVISYGSYINSDYDDLEEVPLYRRSNDMLFFAEGTVRWSNWALSTPSNPNGECLSTQTNNTYSAYSYYFLTEGDTPLEMTTLDAPASTTQTLTTYPEHYIIDNDAYSWYTGGTTFYDSYNYFNGNSQSYTLPTPDVDTTCVATISLAMAASATSITNAIFTLNSRTMGSFVMGAVTSEYDKATTGSRSFTAQNLRNSNTLTITTTRGNAARLDYIRVNYRRRLRKTGDFLVFSHYSAQPATMQLQGANANTQIWRIGYPHNPIARVNGTLSGATLSFNVDNPSLRYVAVDVNATYPSPERVGTIANQDLHADSVADMVIIIPESGKLLEQAERLADFHQRHDSLRVRIVRADQLYNEFSSGTPDAGAYRRYLKMLYDRNSEGDMPQYLLLMGNCVWDNRGVTEACANLDLKDYLLSYESVASTSEVTCYVTDDWFALLDDGEGGNVRYEKVDLGVGRLPVGTEAEAKRVVDKIIAYVESPQTGSWKNAVYFIADDADNNKHMSGAEDVAQKVEQYFPNLKVNRIYLDAYKRVATATGFTYPQVTTDIYTAMNKGALLMNYTGHGAPYCLAKEMILRTSDFKAFSNPKVPMWVVASCEIVPYDRLEENIGVESMLNPNGGAIAFMGSARAVYTTQNNYINNYFTYYVFSKQNGRRLTIGDAMRMAKVNLVSSVDGEVISNRDYTINKLKYALMGDPALTLAMPTQTAVVDSINGVALSSGTVPNLSAGSMARFSGHLEDENGDRLPEFNGQVSVTLYDSQDTITCLNNANEEADAFVFETYSRMLFEGNDSVRGGSFSVTMPVPMDIKYSGQTGLAKLYAVNADHSLEANGTDKRFTIGGTSPDITNSGQGPSLYIYLNNPDFRNGDKVNSTPYFYANLRDSDGINITGNGVGHDLELIVDGKESTTYILNPYYQNDFGSYTSGTVSYMIPELEDGDHYLMFRAWDVKNNSSSARLDFVVDASLRPQISEVALSNNPASTSTTFIISYDRPNTETTFTIDVYNLWGQRCWHHQETATSSSGYHTITWDLSSGNGLPLLDGLYLYEVGISCNGSKESIKKQKLIILRQ